MSKKHDVVPGTAYHLISRFVAKQWFVASHVERDEYLRLLGTALAGSDWRCFSYAVMSNHIHLGLVAGKVPLGLWLPLAHSPFAIWTNERLERIGAVFVRGPTLRGVLPDGVARLIAYVHNNPVRAGVVGRASQSSWTSQRAYEGSARVPSWLDVSLGLQLTGFATGKELGAWVETSNVDRAELELALASSRPRGRPCSIPDFMVRSDREMRYQNPSDCGRDDVTRDIDGLG
ncbi:MAG TPA: hypothetical protein VIU61_03565 [Kofleriaceae bacterium]